MARLLRLIFILLFVFILVACSPVPQNQPASTKTSAVTPPINDIPSSTIVPLATITLTLTAQPSATPTPTIEPTLPLVPMRWDDPKLLEEIIAVIEENPDEIAPFLGRSPGLGIGQELLKEGKGYQNIYLTLNGCAFVGVKEIQLGKYEKALISFFLFPLGKENDYIILPVLSGYQKGPNVGRITIYDFDHLLSLERRVNWSYEEAKAYLLDKELFTPSRVNLQFTFNEQGEFDKNSLAYNIRKDQDFIWALARFPDNRTLEDAVKSHVDDDYAVAAGNLPNTVREVEDWAFNLITKPILNSLTKETTIGLIGDIDFTH